ncbi:MAG: hypothetical protein Q9205_007926 [Flavoplaca limonia]
MTVSSTITAERYESQIMQPLLKGTNNVLLAAFSKPSIKRIVMTSSLMAIVPYQELFVLESFATFNEASTIQFAANPPYDNALEALYAGKAKALAASNMFLAKKKPHFTVINLMPAINRLLRHLRGENVPTKLPSQTVFIEDVAKIHALAPDTEKVAKTQNFLLTSDGMNGSLWYRVKEIVKKDYIDTVKKG